MLFLEPKPNNWYNYDVSHEINFIKMFVANIEKQVDLSIANYEAGKKTIVEAEDEETNTYEAFDEYEGLDSHSWDLEGIFKGYFPNLQRRSALITIFSFFENELDKLCVLFENHENFPIGLKDLGDKGINRSINYLKKVAMLDIQLSHCGWDAIQKNQKIRNIIVHNGGRLVDLKGQERKSEIEYVKACEFLSGETEVMLKNGFLNEVLKSFELLFIHINEKIQLKYPPAH